MLEVFHYYNDLCKEIDILEIQINAMIEERKSWFFGGRLFHSVPLDNAAERVDKLSSKIEKYDKLLEYKKRLKKQIELKFSELESKEYKVAYKRFVEKKTLEQIADELGYGIDWVKKISAKVTMHLEYTDILIYDDL